MVPAYPLRMFALSKALFASSAALALVIAMVLQSQAAEQVDVELVLAVNVSLFMWYNELEI